MNAISGRASQKLSLSDLSILMPEGHIFVANDRGDHELLEEILKKVLTLLIAPDGTVFRSRINSAIQGAQAVKQAA
jgi:hypothetical protein